MRDPQRAGHGPTSERSEGLFRAVFEQAAIGVAQVVSKTGTFVRANRRYAEILGYTVSEVEQLTLQEITHPDDLQRDQENMRKLLSGEIREFSLEKRYLHKDGSIVRVNVTVSPVWQIGEDPDYHIVIVEDITERKHSEEAVRQTQEYYRALVEGLPDIVLRYDREGRHLFVSENVEEAVDFSASQFFGKTDRELGFPEDLCGLWEKAIGKVFESGLSYETEFSFESKTGPQTRNWRLVPERDHRGHIRSVLSISRDVTEYRRVEQDYQTLFREMHNGFALHEIICDDRDRPVDYRFLAVNPAFERLTGMKSEDLVGKTVLEVMPNTERHWIETYGRVALDGEPIRFENHSEELDKHYIVTAFQPAPRQFACVFDDITEHKRAEEAIQEARDYAENLIQTANAIVVVLDIEGKIKVFNDTAEKITGYTAEELRSKSWFETLVPRDQYPEVWVEFERLQQGGIPVSFENPILTKAGKERQIAWQNSELFYHGQFAGTVSFGIDITDRKRAEKALLESEERYRLAQRLSDVGTWEWNVASNHVFWSDEVHAMWGLDPGKFGGTYAEVAQRIHPDDLGRWRENVRACVEDGKEHNIEYRIVWPDGTIRWVAAYGDAERGEDGRACRLMGVIMDVTERKQTEEALRGSEEQLRTIVQTMPVMVVAVDSEQNILVWNWECERVTGYTAEEMTRSSHAVETLYPDAAYREWLVSTVDKVGGDFRNLEFDLTCKNGDVRTILWSNRSCSHPIAGWATWAVGLDISDRKRAEEALRESEEQLRTVVQTMPIMVDAFDEDQNVIVWNRECERVTGYMADEVVGNPHAMELLYPEAEYREWVMGTVRKQEGDFRNLEFTLTCKNGKARTILWSNLSTSHPIAGWATWAVGLDVTERQAAERQLEANTERLRLAMQAASMGTWEWDVLANRVAWSPETLSIFGTTAEEFGGTYEAYMSFAAPEAREMVAERVRRFLENSAECSVIEYNHRIIRGDGEPGWVEVRGTLFLDDQGRPAWMTGVCADVTERNLAEKEREKLITELEAQNAELERFTYTVSHDLKSPLITIKGYIGMLSEDLDEGEMESVRDDLARISNAADKMGVLLEDLLELSRIGRLMNQAEEVPLRELVNEALGLVGGQVEERGVQVDVLSDLPVLCGDRTRLLEVLQNLIDNAVKYLGAEPRPRIEIGARKDGDEIVCYVRDNGLGIEPRYHDKVFGLFDQLDPNVEGTGIGLALVKRIVEVHGGRVWIESEGKGCGSTFCFTIPRPLPFLETE